MTVSAVYRDDVEVAAARGGENLRLRVAGVDEDDVAGGFVLCSRSKPVPCVTYFDAQLQVASRVCKPSPGSSLGAKSGLLC